MEMKKRSFFSRNSLTKHSTLDKKPWAQLKIYARFELLGADVIKNYIIVNMLH